MDATFGIVMPTYRADDGTLQRLRRTLKSIEAQTYPHWRLYLIGDRFEPEAEFKKAVGSLTKKRVVGLNLARAVERETLQGWELWHCGGATANNVGLTLAERDGIQYTCHLDHDDLWLPHHLQTLADAYERYPRAAFIYTRARYETVEKTYDIPEQVIPADYDNLWPETCHIVHGTASWRLDWVPVRYAISRDQPADAMMWHRIKEWCKRKQLPMVYIPQVTVVKKSKEADAKVRRWKHEAMRKGIYKAPY